MRQKIRICRSCGGKGIIQQYERNGRPPKVVMVVRDEEKQMEFNLEEGVQMEITVKD